MDASPRVGREVESSSRGRLEGGSGEDIVCFWSVARFISIVLSINLGDNNSL
jgi:hypothetical protein